ncbi:MAG: glycoside hydrolase N-terminal domain-containing protein [Paramuribaculum sp.]|nr:glycoside hydrolase N-terminal domain-containing protein [Paramuribaculum sp.]
MNSRLYSILIATGLSALTLNAADQIDYRKGNAIWFDTPTPSYKQAAWTYNDFSTTATNPDTIWERLSLPIGNGSFGGNIMGSVGRERVVLNEKTLWTGGPGTGAERYWNMNRTVKPEILEKIRHLLAVDSVREANRLVAEHFRGNINYDRNVFGTYTVLGEAYVSTTIDENSVSDYKRILNVDESLALVEFDSNGSHYERKYFTSYPDSVMVWQFTSDGEPMTLSFGMNIPQKLMSIKKMPGGLLYSGVVDNNNMEWALRVYVRCDDPAAVIEPDANKGTILISNCQGVEFLLAADTDYKMNFDPDFSDAKTYAGVDPVKNVNQIIDLASKLTYQELFSRHQEDYKALYDRVALKINPIENEDDIYLMTTPARLNRYKSGTLDHQLEELYYQMGRYLLISSSRAGNMPANLQGMWHNNIDGPWRVDYHNNINLQMNYWPATNANLLECFIPFIDYVRGLVKPGAQTAKDYYGARGWTAEVSTNIFGFTAPLNSGEMSWNYNPTAGPWLTTQIWEYYDYTRDKDWLREVGYPIISESADFVSDLLYKHDGYYTSSPSYSPEHGPIDIGATYANAVTKEVLKEAIEAATILGIDAEKVAEWQEKYDNMMPYKIGKYGQLQEWYKDIDEYGDQHRHTNHLFGLHPGTTINALSDTVLTNAAKETLRQRGDAATGWSMGWKLNHWARLLDGNHAYVLFQNLLKNGTATNLWDMHPPFQIDGNFGGTAGITEMFVQSHNGLIQLLPALPDDWKDVNFKGARTRGNFVVDLEIRNGKLEEAIVHSGSGENLKIYYLGQTAEIPTEAGKSYKVTYDENTKALTAAGI